MTKRVTRARETDRARRVGGRTRPGLLAALLLLTAAACASSGPAVEPRPALAIVTGLRLTPEASPGDVALALQQALVDVWRVANDPAVSPEDKRTRVREEISAWLDGDALARAALGERAAAYPPDDAREFAQAYVHYVTAMFVTRFARSTERPVEITSARLGSEDEQIAVTARGTEPSGLFRAIGLGRSEVDEPIRLDLVLRRRGDHWRITSVAIDSVDVGTNFRAQFESVLDRFGPEFLVSELRTHNEKADARNPFAP